MSTKGHEIRVVGEQGTYRKQLKVRFPRVKGLWGGMRTNMVNPLSLASAIWI